MTQIEISRKLAKDAELEPQKADAIIQAIAEYTQSVAPVTRDHLDKRLAELESSLKGWVFTITLAINALFAGVIVGAVYAMIQTLKHP